MGVIHSGNDNDGGGRPTGENREAGVGERGGDIQHEHVLHVPRHKEAVLWDGCEPNSP